MAKRGLLGVVTLLDEQEIARCIGLKPKSQGEQQPVVISHDTDRADQPVGSSSVNFKPIRARPSRLNQHYLMMNCR